MHSTRTAIAGDHYMTGVRDPIEPDSRAAMAANGVQQGRRSVDLVLDGDHAIEWVSGEIDIAERGHVVALGAAAIDAPHVMDLVIDLSHVTFLDASGLGALIELTAHAAAAHKRLALRGVTPPIQKLLVLTELNDAFGLTGGDLGRC